LLSRSAIPPSPTREGEKESWSGSPGGVKTGGKGMDKERILIFRRGRRGSRDKFREEEGAPREVGRNHGLF
jgi:hypothetical protein